MAEAETLHRATHLTLESQPLLEFRPFPRLPAELRLKIWSLIHPGVREVHITCQKGRTPTSQPKMFAQAFTSNKRPPVTCHICPESRREALEIYTPLFRTTHSDCSTYVCFEKDTITMADKDIGYLGAEEKNGIRRMKITVVDCANFGRYHISMIKGMKSLEELEVVMDERVVMQERSPRGLSPPQQLRWDLEDEKMDDPAWECPEIRIVGSDTGKIFSSLRGGALVPGWKVGDPFPE